MNEFLRMSPLKFQEILQNVLVVQERISETTTLTLMSCDNRYARRHVNGLLKGDIHERDGSDPSL